jgi:hypothetical protein
VEFDPLHFDTLQPHFETFPFHFRQLAILQQPAVGKRLARPRREHAETILKLMVMPFSDDS